MKLSKVENNRRNHMNTKKEKTGGRVQGTPNKRTLEALDVFGEFCPLQMVLQKLQGADLKDDLYIGTCLKLMEFKFPKRKAIEHSINLSELSKEELINEAKAIILNMTGEQL